jgi:hypothetical protein
MSNNQSNKAFWREVPLLCHKNSLCLPGNPEPDKSVISLLQTPKQHFPDYLWYGLKKVNVHTQWCNIVLGIPPPPPPLPLPPSTPLPTTTTNNYHPPPQTITITNYCQYSKTNKMHFMYSIYYELAASTCFEHYLLIFRRCWTHNNCGSS